MRRIQMIGHTIGNLTILKVSHKNSRGHLYYLCRCVCGQEKPIAGYKIRNRTVKSCGCMKRLPAGSAALKAVYRKYQYGAKKRNIEFTLSLKQFQGFTTQRCHYCGVEPSQVCNVPHYNGSYTYNGLDRVDNLQGYHKYNCVACCRRCNVMKSDMTIDYFLSHIKKILSTRAT
jgi:hypothetical protein